MCKMEYDKYTSFLCTVFRLANFVSPQVLSAPFAYFHPAVSHQEMRQTAWIGEIATVDIGFWADGFLLLIFGGIPWQVF